MPGPSIGDAVLEVTADLSQFDASLQAGLKDSQAAVKKSGNDMGSALGEGISRGADGRLRDSRGRFVKAGSSLGAAVVDSAEGEVKKQAAKVAEPLKKQTEKTVRQLAGNTARQFANLGKTIGGEFAKAGRAAGAALINSPLGKAAKTVFAPIAKAASAVRDRVVSAFTTIRGKVTSAFSGLGSLASKAFAPIGGAARKIGGVVSTAFDHVRTGASTVFSKVSTAASTAFTGITTAAAKIKAPISRAMNSALGQQVQSSFSKIKDAASSAFGSLGPLAQKAFPKIGTVASGVFGKISGFASRATGAIGTAFAKVQPAVSKALSGLGNITKSAFSKVGSIASSAMSKVMTGIKGLAIGVGAAAVAGVGATITKGFSRLTGIENAEASLKGLGYTAKEAANIINGPVMDAVKGTAFGLDEAAAAAQGALGAGVENGTALADYLTLVGDAASQAQVDFNSMAMIMNKVQGAGKLTGDTLQQMAENNLQVMPMLTKAYGKSQEEIQKMVSNGEISAKEFQKILQENIGGAAQKAGDTVTGAFRNMGAAMGRLGAKFLGGSFSQLQKVFAGISNSLDAFGPQAEKVGNALGKFIKPAADAIANFGKTAKEGGIGDALAAFSPVMTIIKAAIPVLSAFGSTFKGVVSDQMKSFGKALSKINPQPIADALAAIGNAAIVVVRAFGKIDLGAIIGPLAQAFVSLAGVVEQIMPPIMSLISALGDSLGKILPVIAKSLGVVATALAGALGDVLKAILPSLTTFVTIIADTLAQVLPLVAQLLAAVVKVLAQGLAAVLPSLLDALVPLVELLGQALMAVLPPLIKLFKDWGPLITLNAKLTAFLASAVLEIVSAFVAVITGTKDFKTAMSDAFSGIGKAFQPIIDAAMWVYDKLFGHSIFPDMLDAMTGWVKNIGKVFSGVWTHIKNTFTKIKNWVGSTWKNSWSKVSTWMSGAVSKGRDTIGKLWEGTKDKFSSAKNWTRDSWRKSWSNVSEWMSAAVSKGRDRVGKLWQSTRDKFSAARKWTGSTWRQNWSKVSGWMSNAVEKGRSKVGDAWKGTRSKFSDARAWVKNNWRPNWSSVKDWMTNPVQKAKETITRFLGREGVRKVLTGFVTAAGKIMDGLKKAMGAPVQWVVNKVLVPLSKAARSVGNVVGLNIPEIKPMEAFARGGIAPDASGIMPGYTPGRDTSIIGVGGGEAIMRPEFTRAAGPSFVYAANAAARTGGVQGAKRFLAEQRYGQYAGGFAQGGVVQPVPGRGNRHTSGYNWATWAGDYPNPMGTPVHAWKQGVVAAVKYLTTSYGQHVRMNHPDGSSSLYAHMSRILVDVGQKLSAGQVLGKVGSTGNSTGPHLHFETMGAPWNGGSGTDTGSAALGMLDDVRKALKFELPSKYGKNDWTDVLIKLPQKIGEAALSKLTSLVSAIGDGVMSAASWVGSKFAGLNAEQRDNAAKIIDVAHQLGFGDRGAIIGLITGLVESGLRNVGYGDRDSVGLFQQRAPWGPRADRMNPSKSASMFFNGGQGGQPGLRDKNWRSGSLGALAQAVQVSAFPGRYALQVPRAQLILQAFKAGSKKYDNGGWVPPGFSVMHNATGRREPAAVFTTEQWATLQAIAQGERRSRHQGEDPVHIHLHGVIDSASAAREIETLMISRGRKVRGVDLPSRSRRAVRPA